MTDRKFKKVAKQYGMTEQEYALYRMAVRNRLRTRLANRAK